MKNNFKYLVNLIISGEYDTDTKTEDEAINEAVQNILSDARSNAEFDGERDGVTVTDIADIDNDQNTENLQELYFLVCKKFRENLLGQIKSFIHNISPEGNPVNVEELYSEGEFDRICVYDMPKNEADNFSLFEFGIDKNDELYANGNSITNDCGSDYFCQSSFSISELIDIKDMLETVNEGIASGEYAIDDKGVVSIYDED